MSKLLSVLAIAFATIFSFNAMAEQHSGHGVHGFHASKAHGEKAKAHAEKDEAHAKDAKAHAEKDASHAKEAKAHAEKDEAHAKKARTRAERRKVIRLVTFPRKRQGPDSAFLSDCSIF